MNYNLIKEFCELSHEILKKNNENNDFQSELKHSAVLLCKKAFDVIHHFDVSKTKDPCLDVNGKVWRPQTVISDYSYELERQGIAQASQVLWESVETVLKSNPKCTNEILTFLLLLKKPFSKENFVHEHPFSLTGHDYFFKELKPFELLPAEITTPALTKPFKLNKDHNSFLDRFVNKNEVSKKEELESDYQFSLQDLLGAKEVSPFEEKTSPSHEHDQAKLETCPEVGRKCSANCEKKTDWLEENIDDNFLFYKCFHRSSPFIATYEEKLLNSESMLPKRKKRQRGSSNSEVVLNVYCEELELINYFQPVEKKLDIVPILLEFYVTQVKYLLYGVNSDLFVYDESEKKFYMKVGTCLSNVTPEALFDFSRQFMDIGSYFLRLKEVCEEGQHISIASFGSIYQTLWKSVSDYLQKHSNKVAEISSSSGLLELEEVVSDLHATIKYISKLCLRKEGVPVGGQLLSYLYQACITVRQEQLQQILISFLIECTSVYISKIVEPWIFEGYQDCIRAIDFFVYFDPDLTSRRDRSYYQGISAIDDQIPCFLKEMADRILNCGKSVHLLQLFSPDNVFSKYTATKKHPKMKLCQSEESILLLSYQFESYEAEITRLCGEPITYKTIRLKNVEEEEERDEIIRDIQAKSPSIKPKLDFFETKRRKQEEQSRMLKEQIEEADFARKVRKEQEIIEGKRIQEQAAKMREEEDIIIAQEKQKVKEYYDGLLEEVEVVKERMAWRHQRLNLAEKRDALFEEDVLNINNVLDREGNIISKEDIDEVNDNFIHTPEIIPRNEEATIDEEGNAISATVHHMEENANFDLSPCDNEPFLKKDKVTSENDTFKEIRAKIHSENVMEARNNKSKILGSNDGCSGIAASMSYEDVQTIYEDEPLDSQVVLQIQLDNKAEAQKNKLRVLGCEFGLSDKIEPVLVDAPISEASRNKLKVLGTEFDIISSSTEQESHRSEMITESMSNKLKILGSEYNIITNEEKEPAITEAPLSDAARNILKVYETECNVTDTKLKSEIDQNTVVTEAMKNKLKILGTEYNLISGDGDQAGNKIELPLTEALKNKRKVLGTEYHLVPSNLADISGKSPEGPLTDAMKNKLKVLNSEYNIILGDGGEGADIIKQEGILTDAQRNKLKVLGTEFDIAVVDNNVRSQKTARTVELAQAQINKKKVLGTELDVFDEPFKSSRPPKPMADNTPSPVEENICLMPNIVSSSFNFDSLIVKPANFEDSSVLFPSLPALFPKEDPPKEFALNSEQCIRLILKSINTALSVQEKLANGAILKHFLVDENYMSHVFSLRCYFLLHDGEFSRSLTVNLFESLEKCTTPKQFFAVNSLSTILDDALRYTIHNSDNAQNLSFQILEMPSSLDHEAFNVLAPFQLSYKVKWPLNLVLTDSMLSRYRKIFHVLVSLKRIHWILNETFHHLKIEAKDKKLNGTLLINSPHYIKLSVYRHAMTLFIMTLEEHMSANGPQDAWSLFLRDMDNATTLDGLHTCHVKYVKDLLRRCFLIKGSQDLLSYINELISLGLKFHYIVLSSTWRMVNEKHYEHPKFYTLKTIFKKFCETTSTFQKTLRRKVQHTEMKDHLPLVHLIDMKIKCKPSGV